MISACEGSFFWIFDASKIRQSFTFTNLLCMESSCNIFSTFLFCWCSKHWRKSTSDKPFEFPLQALRGSRVPNQIFKINPNFFNYIHQWTYFKCFLFNKIFNFVGHDQQLFISNLKKIFLYLTNCFVSACTKFKLEHETVSVSYRLLC